jgi:Toprim domain-containing protein
MTKAIRAGRAAADGQVVPATDNDYHEVAQWLLDRTPLERQKDVADYLRLRGLLTLARTAGWAALPGRRRQGCLLAELLDLHGLQRGVACDLISLDPLTGEPKPYIRYPEHRLVIPWRAAGVDGAVVALQRRLVAAATSQEMPRYIFPRGRAPRDLYGADRAVEQLSDDTGIAYVEGAVDVLALQYLMDREKNDTVVVGLPGLGAWHERHARWAQGRVAYVAVDADEAGDRAAPRIMGDLKRAGAKSILRLRPQGPEKDWASFLEG